MMKLMKKKVSRAGILAAVMMFMISVFSTVSVSALSFNEAMNNNINTFAAGGGDVCDTSKVILGLRPWWQGLAEPKEGSCVIVDPEAVGGLAPFVWTIVLNILADLFFVVGIAALIFAIYGGFQYIMSAGDPGKAASGKTTLTNAMIGLVIALLANLITNTIINILFTA